MKKYSKGTVRKNVTLAASTVDMLEKMSAMCNLTQSEILEIALSQPLFQLTRCFIKTENSMKSKPMCDLISVAGATHDAGICDRTLNVVREIMLDGLALEQIPTMSWSSDACRCYIMHTMPEAAKKKSKFFNDLFQLCIHDAPAVTDRDYMQQLVLDYIHAMLLLKDEPDVFENQAMYQMLAVVIDGTFEDVTEEHLWKLYHRCVQEGLVLADRYIMDIFK